jgi:hypothetical protein
VPYIPFWTKLNKHFILHDFIHDPSAYNSILNSQQTISSKRIAFVHQKGNHLQQQSIHTTSL